MAFDPDRYADDVVLSTHEVVEWTGWKRRTVLSLPGLSALKVPTNEYQFRAGDVKRAILGDHRQRSATKRDGRVQLLKAVVGA